MKYSKTGTVFFWVMVLSLLTTAVAMSTLPLDFKHATFIGVNKLFATIFVMTLFMERAQEVILTTWRAKGSEALDLAIGRLERAIFRQKKFKFEEANQEPILDDMYDELEALRLEKLNYRSHTRILALRLGLIFGLLISIGGVRTLGMLVSGPEALSSLSAFQYALFSGVDIILTGGVIAGGSDGIHKITALYRSYMESKEGKQKRNVRDFEGLEKGV